MPGSVFTGYTAPQTNQNMQYILSGLMNLFNSVGNAAKTNQQNSLANQYMSQQNTQNAPRAALVNPENGQTSEQWSQANNVPITGTLPVYPTASNGQLGGLPELQMHMNIQQQQSNNALNQARMQYALANTNRANSAAGLNDVRANTLMNKDQTQKPITQAQYNELAGISQYNQQVRQVIGTDMMTADKYRDGWIPDPTHPGNYTNPKLKMAAGLTGDISIDANTYNKIVPGITGNVAKYNSMRKMIGNNQMDQAMHDAGMTNINSQLPQPQTPPMAGTTGKYQTPNTQMTGNQYVNSVVGPPATPPNSAPQPQANVTPPAVTQNQPGAYTTPPAISNSLMRSQNPNGTYPW